MSDENTSEFAPTPITRLEYLYDRMVEMYHNRYHWEIFKSTALFLIGLKIANELYHVAIPMKEYQPFKGFCGTRCCF